MGVASGSVVLSRRSAVLLRGPELKVRSCLPAQEIQSLFPVFAATSASSSESEVGRVSSSMLADGSASLPSSGIEDPSKSPLRFRRARSGVFHQEPRGEGVDVRIGRYLGRVEEQLLPTHQSCLKAHLYGPLEEAPEDSQAIALADPGEAGVVRQWLI